MYLALLTGQTGHVLISIIFVSKIVYSSIKLSLQMIKNIRSAIKWSSQSAIGHFSDKNGRKETQAHENEVKPISVHPVERIDA